MAQGLRTDLSSPLRYGSEFTNVERLISKSRSCEAEGDDSTKRGACAPAKIRPTCDRKGRGVIRISRRDAKSGESWKQRRWYGDPVLEWKAAGRH